MNAEPAHKPIVHFGPALAVKEADVAAWTFSPRRPFVQLGKVVTDCACAVALTPTSNPTPKIRSSVPPPRGARRATGRRNRIVFAGRYRAYNRVCRHHVPAGSVAPGQ